MLDDSLNSFLRKALTPKGWAKLVRNFVVVSIFVGNKFNQPNGLIAFCQTSDPNPDKIRSGQILPEAWKPLAPRNGSAQITSDTFVADKFAEEPKVLLSEGTQG